MLRFKLKRAFKKMSKTRILIYCTLFLILGISSVSLFKMYALTSNSTNIITGLSSENYVNADEVYIDDTESDYNYYIGLNFNEVKSSTAALSGKSTGKYNDQNLVNVRLNYSGKSVDGTLTGKTSYNESQYKYTYDKVYPVTTYKGKSYLVIELIDNPFSNLPYANYTTYAFDGWVMNGISDNDGAIDGSFINLDKETYTRTLYVPVDAVNQTKVVINLNAAWVMADICEFKGSTCDNNLNYGFNGFTGIEESQFTWNENGHVFIGDFSVVTKYLRGYYVNTQIDSSKKNLYYNDQLVSCADIDCGTNGYILVEDAIKTVDDINRIVPYGAMIIYKFATRDTNIYYMTDNLKFTVLTGIDKPGTLTGSYNGNSPSGNATISYAFGAAASYNSSLKTDVTVNNIKYTTAIYGYGGSNFYSVKVIVANHHNLKIGRNVTYGAYNTGITGIVAGSNTTESFKRSKIIVESCNYNFISGGSLLERVEVNNNVKIQIGSDYDRATNNNSKLNIAFSVMGGWYGKSEGKNADDSPNVEFTIKSGKIGYTVNDNRLHNSDYSSYGLYIGTRGSLNDKQMNYYTAVQEGGEIAHVIGGPGGAKGYTGMYSAFYMKGGVAEYVIGGAAITQTYGNRAISLTGGTVLYDVFGGSNAYNGSYSANTKNSENGTMSGDTYIYIGGNANVGYSGLDTSKTLNYYAKPGCVFGAGGGNSSSDKIGSVNSAYVTVDGNAHIYGSVYGGGNYGSTGKMDISGTVTNININSGTIGGSVYGSSNQNGSGIVGKVTVNENASSVIFYWAYGYVYANSVIPATTSATHSGNVADNIAKDTVKVFDNYLYDGSQVPSNGKTCTSTTPGYDQTKGMCLYFTGIIPPGTDLTYWKKNNGANLYAQPFWYFDVLNNPTLDKGCVRFYTQVPPSDGIGAIELNWFIKNDQGETYGNEAHTLTLNVNGGSIGDSVYGGSDTGGTVFANVFVNLNGGTVTNNVFGAGKGEKTYVSGDVTVNVNDGFKATNVYGGSEIGIVNFADQDYDDKKERSVTVNIYGGTVENVFGGSKGKIGVDTTLLYGDVNVYVHSGNNVSNVYGGNDVNGTALKNSRVYLNGGYVNNAYGGSRSTGFDVTNIYLNGGSAGNVFGGSNISGTVNSSNVYVLSGSAENVYGGNNAGGTVNSSKVILNKGTIGSAYACGYGSGTSCSDSFILVNGIESPSASIYGGGYSAVSNNPTKVVVNKGIVGDVYGGNNYSGTVAKSNVYVTDGTVSRVFGGNNAGGMTSETNLFIGSGTIGQVFGGSNGENTFATTTNVHIYGGTITDIFGGGNESGATETNVNVYGGTVTNTFGGSNQKGTVTTTNVNIGDNPSITQVDLSDSGITDTDEPVPDEEEEDDPCVVKTTSYEGQHYLNAENLTTGTYSESYNATHSNAIDYFDIVGTDDKKYTVRVLNGKTVIDVGGRGTANYRSVIFKVTEPGRVVVNGRSNIDQIRSLRLAKYDESGTDISSETCDFASVDTTCTFYIEEPGNYYLSSASQSILIYDVEFGKKVVVKDYSACDSEDDETVEYVTVAKQKVDTFTGLNINAHWFGISNNNSSSYSENRTMNVGGYDRPYRHQNVSAPTTYNGTEYSYYFSLYPPNNNDYSAPLNIYVPEGASNFKTNLIMSSARPDDSLNYSKQNVVEKNCRWDNSVNAHVCDYVQSYTFDLVLKEKSSGRVVETKSYDYRNLSDVFEVEFSGLEAGKSYEILTTGVNYIYEAKTTYTVYVQEVVQKDGPITVTPEGNVINWRKVKLEPYITWNSGSEAYNHGFYECILGQTVIAADDPEHDKKLADLKKEVSTYVGSNLANFYVENPYNFDITDYTIKFYTKDSYIDLIPIGGVQVSQYGVNNFRNYIEKTEENYYIVTEDKSYENDEKTIKLKIPANYKGLLDAGSHFTVFSKAKPVNYFMVAQWQQIWDYVPVSGDSGGAGVGGTTNTVDTSFDSTIYKVTKINTTNVFGGNNDGGTTINGNVNLYAKSSVQNTYGGGFNAVTTNAVVNHLGGSNNKVYGGGKNALVSNSTVVNFNFGTAQTVYGGGERGDVGSTSTVNVFDGTITTAVFGSGNNANTGSATSDGISTVNLIGGTIIGDVYGGAYSQVVYGYTDVNVGAATVLGSLTSLEHNSKLVVSGNIYGGGQTSSAGDDSMDFTFVSVTKGATVDLDSTGNSDYTIEGSIFGSGNNSVVSDMSNSNAVVNIKNLGTADNIESILSIQRADVVNLENNYLRIIGDVDSTSNIDTSKMKRRLLYAFNRINNLHMINSNELYLENGANMLFNLYSEYRDSKDTLQKESIDITVEKDEEGNVVLEDGIVKSNTVSNQNGHNEIYMAKTRVLNVLQTETPQSRSEGNVYGMAFLGIFEYDDDSNSINKGFYDPELDPKDVVDEDLYSNFKYSGTYVYGKHYTNHDITVDGFYTNYIDDSDARGIRVDYVKPTPESSTYYMWTIGVVSSKFEIELSASKYSTLGAAVLPLTSFDNPDAEFWVESVDTSGLADGVNLTDKNNVKKVADNVDIANTTFGLSMDTGNSSIGGWKSISSTDFMAVNKYSGDDKYDADSTYTTPSLSFYLHHSKNVDYEEADNDGDLGYVLIYLTSRIPDPTDPTKYDVRNIEITVYLSIIEDGEDGYGSAITPGKRYSVFPSTLTNITHKSSFSIYENLYIDLNNKVTKVKAVHDEENDTYLCSEGYTKVDTDPENIYCTKPFTVNDLYPTGSFRQLTSKMLFPVGTNITMIDLATNKYYQYTVTDGNIVDKRRQLEEQREVTYYLSEFKEMSTVVLEYPKVYDNAVHNNIYYHKTEDQEYAYEEFVFTVDFENVDSSVDMNEYIVNNASLYLELMSPQTVNGKNKQIMKPISDDLGNMYYNIYKTDFNGIVSDASFESETVYAGQINTLNINTEIIKQLNDETVNNTVYDEYKLGAKITVFDEQGNQLDGSTLLGMTLSLGDTQYNPSIDGSFRVRLADAVTTINSAITVDIGNANLTTGRYKFKIETFGSADGIYSKSGEATTVNEIYIYVVNSKFGLEIKQSDVSVTHDSTTGKDQTGESVIEYTLTTSSGLANPNLRVSLQRRLYRGTDYYSLNYETIDLADIVKDSSVLQSTSITKQYLIPNAFYDVSVDGPTDDEFKKKTFTYSLELGNNLTSGTYKVVFSVYDGDQYIGENYAYLIIRKI